MCSLTWPQPAEIMNRIMAGIISTIMARYHEISMLAAAQKSHASIFSCLTRRLSLSLLNQKKRVIIAGVTTMPASKVEPIREEKRNVAILVVKY